MLLQPGQVVRRRPCYHRWPRGGQQVGGPWDLLAGPALTARQRRRAGRVGSIEGMGPRVGITPSAAQQARHCRHDGLESKKSLNSSADEEFDEGECTWWFDVSVWSRRGGE